MTHLSSNARRHARLLNQRLCRIPRWFLPATIAFCFLPVLFLCTATHLRAESTQAFWVHRQPAQVRSAASQRRSSTHKSPPPAKATQATVASSANAPEALNGRGSLQKSSAAPSQRSISESLAIGNSSPWAVVTGLTLLTILPAIVLAMTPLVRLLVVFHFLRQALGTQTAPSNQILMGLALMMTWFLMQPVIVQVNEQAIVPYRASMLDGETALSKGAEPIRHFMLRYARDKDLELFSTASGSERMQTRNDAPMRVVVPAYMLSELKSGFQIGAILFLPFLLIDLVVASVTTSVGMVQLPPVVISTPVKILLFVMVDGWHLLVSSLLKSF